MGAIIIFSSLAFPWYEIRLSGGNTVMYVSDLIKDAWGVRWTLWFGSALPVIAVIVLTSSALLSVIYTSVKGKKTTCIWGYMGIISMLCIIINAVYLLIWYRNNFNQWSNIVDPGVVMAFVGSVVMALSYTRIKE